MKTPTAEPQTPTRGQTYDIGTWLTVLLGIAALVKLGVIIARHL